MPPPRPPVARFSVAVLATLLAVGSAAADDIGTPLAVEVSPPAVALAGPRDARQIVVTGTYADGTARDLTHLVAATVEPAGVVDVQGGLYLRPRADGPATLTVTAGAKTVRVPVAVAGMGTPSPVSFRRDVVPVLNVGGCNAGACHGTPSGKNGFKLSLRGFDPAADFVQLTREQFGRRVDRHDPAASLLLAKAVGRVPHEGGPRFGAASLPGELLTAWLAEGLRDDPADLPPLKSVAVTPGPRTLVAPARGQQLAVNAAFADGTTRDVTRLTNFSSSDPLVATVSATGRVEFHGPGEVAVLCRYAETMVAVRLTHLQPRPGFAWVPPPENNFVDTHAFAKLRQMSITPSDACTDGEFVRRAYLDAAGRLPTAAEAAAFLADADPRKRDKLADAVVDLPAFADFWALKWADVLRANRKTLQAKGTHGLRHWLREKWASNTPVDAVVRDLITASGNAGTNPAANYYRIAKDPPALAETTAQLFLGVRMQCAKCHNHPFERWSQDDYYGLAAFFARTKLKADPATVGEKTNRNGPSAAVVYVGRDGEVTQPRTGKTVPPHFPGGGDAPVKADADRRPALAAWLTAPENPFFARSVVNRVWFHLMGKGIVDPVDDFRASNPSCNDALLDALAADFVAHKFDLKHLVRTVLKSRTYQLSARPTDANRDDARYFSHALPRLLTAEQLLDAVCDVTGVPEKFAGLPAGTRAVQLPDGDGNHPFLRTFGQPARELACECERESDGNLAQALQLVNGPTVNDKVKAAAARLAGEVTAGKSEADVLAGVYLAALSRRPSADESAAVLAHVTKAADRKAGWEGAVWALLNSREFVFRH